MKIQNFTIGIDVGISSIGWSVVELQPSDQNTYFPYRLIDCGVRLFQSAENPKNGQSLALSRREARGVRRNIKRRKHRLIAMKKYLGEIGIIQEKQVNVVSTSSPWEIRAKAILQKVSDRELATAILHIAKRRGFKSNRKSISDDEGGVYKKFIEENKETLHKKNYQTLGSMFWMDPKFSKQKRNKGGNYLCMVDRSMLEDELKMILEKQRDFGNDKINYESIQQIISIFAHQKPFASGEQIKKMVGKCSLESDQLRAPKHSMSFYLFRFWQDIAKVRLYSLSGFYKERNFSHEEKKSLLDFIKNSNKCELRYSDIRKLLQLPAEVLFSTVNYSGKNEKPENKVFIYFKSYHEIKKALKDNLELWEKIKNDISILNEITVALTIYRGDEEIKKYLQENLNLEPKIVDLLIFKMPTFSEFGHLSIKAINKLLPFLEDNHNYYDSVVLAGYSFEKASNKGSLLPVISKEDIKNPIVLRSVSQLRKVINAIIRKYGSPTKINIELARDLSRNFLDRKKIEKLNDANNKENSRIKQILTDDFGLSDPKGIDIQKYKLWREQQEKCVLSQKPIAPHELFNPNTTQIDHAQPFSRTLDDSYFNKILVFTSENQNKKDKNPFEYYGSDENSEKWNKYCSFVNSLQIGNNKKRNLLKQNLSEEVLQRFVNKDLNDTRYIARFIKNYVENNLEFAKAPIKKRVFVVTGIFTSLLRKRYGFNKQRSANSRHHALDAIMVGITLESMAQRVASYAKNCENFIYLADNDKSLQKFPEPWQYFRQDVEARVFNEGVDIYHNNDYLKALYSDIPESLNPLFISWMPNKKARGPAHKETIYSTKFYKNEGVLLKKVPLTSLKLASLDNIHGSDKLLHEALRKKLLEFNDNAQKAFELPFYKPSKNGIGALVKSVKLKEPANDYWTAPPN